MIRKKLLTAIIAVVAVQCILVSSTLAFSQVVSDPAINEVATGTVKGIIVETYTARDNVMPGDTVQKIVNVKNTGRLDAVIRIKLDKYWTLKNSSGTWVKDTSTNAGNILISPDTSKWYEKDGYYYYKGILKPGETTTVPLMREFTLAPSTGNEFRNRHAVIDVNLECLQAVGNANAVEDVWNIKYSDLSITQPAATKSADPTTVTLNSTPKFTFGSGTNLFAGFKEFAPGETRTQTVTVTNSYKNAVEIFLKAQSGTLSSTLIDNLLKGSTIKVVNNATGETIYNGPIYDPAKTGAMATSISLGEFSNGQKKDLVVTLTLDKTLGNEYQDLLGNVKWLFMAEDRAESSSSSRSSSDSSRDRDRSSRSDRDDRSHSSIPDKTVPLAPLAESPVPSSSLPQTGGNHAAMIYMVTGIGILTVVLLALITLYFRQKKIEEAQRYRR